jgi:hypothetical protein
METEKEKRPLGDKGAEKNNIPFVLYLTMPFSESNTI